MQKLIGGVKQTNIHHLRVEDVADLVANQVINCLHLQLGSQPLLNAVDDRQFSGTLFRHFQQALGLVEETRVLNGRGSLRGEGLRHMSVCGSIEILFQFIEREHADHAFAKQERYAQPTVHSPLSVSFIFEMFEARRNICNDDRL